MRTDDALQELKQDEIDITRVPLLPSWLKIKYQYFFLYEEKTQPCEHVP